MCSFQILDVGTITHTTNYHDLQQLSIKGFTKQNSQAFICKTADIKFIFCIRPWYVIVSYTHGLCMGTAPILVKLWAYATLTGPMLFAVLGTTQLLSVQLRSLYLLNSANSTNILILALLQNI